MKDLRLCKNCNQVSEFKYINKIPGYMCTNCNDTKNVHNAIETVRGHMCSNLERFQIEGKSSSCIPQFNIDGSISGCDNTNHIEILFCPFCGTKLPELEAYNRLIETDITQRFIKDLKEDTYDKNKENWDEPGFIRKHLDGGA